MAEFLRTRFVTSRDGKRLRAAVWDRVRGVPDRGVCIVLGGQTEYLEKYLEVFRELAERGYSGASLDWRGQGQSQRLLPNALKAHVGKFAEYDDDLSAFMEQVVRPNSRRPPLALAHSMGAHILLRTMHARPEAFAAAVLTAPMLRVDMRGFPAWFVRVVCRAQTRAGLGGRWVWGMRRRDPLRLHFEKNVVTSDRERFARNMDLLRQYPGVRLSGPTWGWLDAAWHSMEFVMEPEFAERISTPCLLIGAGRDRVVRTEAVREFARGLPRGRYVEIPDARHEILMETDAVRAQFWRHFDSFVVEVAVSAM